MKNLIKDGGKIRNCPNNKAKMSYWQVLKEFHGFGVYAEKLAGSFAEVGEAFMLVGAFMLWLVFFPVLPFVGAYFDRKDAVKMVEAEK